jgi:hypothetical protein
VARRKQTVYLRHMVAMHLILSMQDNTEDVPKVAYVAKYAVAPEVAAWSDNDGYGDQYTCRLGGAVPRLRLPQETGDFRGLCHGFKCRTPILTPDRTAFKPFPLSLDSAGLKSYGWRLRPASRSARNPPFRCLQLAQKGPEPAHRAESRPCGRIFAAFASFLRNSPFFIADPKTLFAHNVSGFCILWSWLQSQ